MTGILRFKNQMRDFCRRYDEVVTPILRFVWSLLVFLSIKHMFGYFELTGRTSVILLLSVLCALLPDGFLFFMAGVVMAADCFAVSAEIGAVFIVMFIILYCVYVRFFSRYAWTILLALVLGAIHLEYGVPVIVGVVAGIGGVIPAACAVVLYYFASATADINTLLLSGQEADQLEALGKAADVFLKNNDMYAMAAAFAVTALCVAIVCRFSFDYAHYVAIAVGIAASILSGLLFSVVFGTDLQGAEMLLGTLIGALLAAVIRICMGVLDYRHTERVQFEDDDYYYYVKVIPKVDSEKQRRH